MNKNEKSMIARLDERTKLIHDDIKDMKNSISRIRGCISTNEKHAVKLDAKLEGHLGSHVATRQWIMWLPSMAAVVASMIALYIGIFA